MAVITESTELPLTWCPAVERVTTGPPDPPKTLSSPVPLGWACTWGYKKKEARGLAAAGGSLVADKDSAYNKNDSFT